MVWVKSDIFMTQRLEGARFTKKYITNILCVCNGD